MNIKNRPHALIAYKRYLHRYSWDHYAILTFNRELSEHACIRKWHKFIKSLEKLTKGRVGWFRIDETMWPLAISPAIPFHFHGMLIYENPPSLKVVTKLWKSIAGRALVEKYHPTFGDDFYMHKFLVWDDANYDARGLKLFKRKSKLNGHTNARGMRQDQIQ